MQTLQNLVNASLLLISAVSLAGCAEDHDASNQGPRTYYHADSQSSPAGGIDPITQDGIDQGNRNTDEAAQTQAPANAPQ